MSLEDSISSFFSFSSKSSSESENTFETDTSSQSSLNSSLSSTDESEDPRAGTRTDDPDLDASLREPLHAGSKLSTWDSYLLIMNYSLRHSLSKQAVKDLLSLVGQHLPKASLSSLYKLKKCFLDLYDDISFNVHYCCSGCHSPFEDRHSVCLNGCSSTATEFLTIPVEPQLKRKLQSKFSHLCDCNGS